MLCSNIEEVHLVLSEVQLPPIAGEAISPIKTSTDVTVKVDIDDDEDDDDEDSFADEDSHIDSSLYVGNRMQFSTEMIVQKFTRNISTSSMLSPSFFELI